VSRLTIPGPVPVAPRKSYTPLLSPLERKAYQIAHKLLMGAVWNAGVEMGTPGGRRVAQVDAIAQVIIEELETH
jgi:hypothetical protein